MSASKPSSQQPVSFGGWMGSMWLYTLLRIALFLVLWALCYWAFGIEGFIAAVIAAFASIPLSYFLLAVPRQRFAAKIEQRVEARREERARLDDELDRGDGRQPNADSAGDE